MRILAIDDNRDNLITLKALIGEIFTDAILFTATSGEEGLGLAKLHDPDVIILDILMPVMDGFEACTNIKADPDLADIPVIFLTAMKGDRDSRIRALECGGEGFLTKPIDETELKAQIRAMARIREARNDAKSETRRLEKLVERRTRDLLKQLTELKKAQEAYKNSEENFTNIFEAFDEGMAYTTLTGKVLNINSGLEKIIGIPRDEIIGKSIINLARKLLTYNNFKRAYPSLLMIIQGRHAPPFEVEYRDKILEITSSINFSTKRLTGIIREVTEQRKMMQELIVARDKAEQSDRLKSAFLANMSHEIRTPMNAIVGFSEMLSDPDLSIDEQRYFGSIIKSRSGDLLHLIDGILDISRIESGNATLNPVDINLASFLREIETESLQSLQQKGKQHLEMVFTLPSTSVRITSDPYILKQVLFNLIDNAIKFTDKGEIRCNTVIEDGRIHFSVADTGIGIAKDQTDLIFKTFTQANIENRAKYRGTGLGLAICKGSVKLLGGDIRVESKPGAGSRFEFSLPYDESGPVIEPQKDPDDRVQGQSQADLQGVHLLLVEDDEVNMDFLKIVLKRTGATFECAGSAAGLRDYYEDLSRFHLVLLDIRLPDAEGWDLVPEIKRIRPDLPVVAQTAYAMSTDRNRGMEAGCDAYISKPVMRDHLVMVIRNMTQKTKKL